MAAGDKKRTPRGEGKKRHAENMREYRKTHKAEIAAARAHAQRTNPEYRRANVARQSARQRCAKNASKRTVAMALARISSGGPASGRKRPTPRFPRQYAVQLSDGRKVPIWLYTRGAVAMRLGVDQSTIRVWVALGQFPAPIMRDIRDRPVFTEDQVYCIVKAFRFRRFRGDEPANSCLGKRFPLPSGVSGRLFRFWAKYPRGVIESRFPSVPVTEDSEGERR